MILSLSSFFKCYIVCVSISAFDPLYDHSVDSFSMDSGEQNAPIGAMPGCERLGWRHGLIDEVGFYFVNGSTGDVLPNEDGSCITLNIESVK